MSNESRQSDKEKKEKKRNADQKQTFGKKWQISNESRHSDKKKQKKKRRTKVDSQTKK